MKSKSSLSSVNDVLVVFFSLFKSGVITGLMEDGVPPQEKVMQSHRELCLPSFLAGVFITCYMFMKELSNKVLVSINRHISGI
jgi:hypothetical protein